MMMRPSSITQWVQRMGLTALLSNMSGLVALWNFQDLSGTVARAINPAVALGRNIVLNPTPSSATSWTLNTGWTYGSSLFTHAAGNTGVLVQSSLPITSTRTYRVRVTASGVSAGSVTPTVLGVAQAAITANGSYSYDVTATATATISFAPTSTFVGSLSLFFVEQTNITASSVYTPAQTPPMSGTLVNGVVPGRDAGNFLGKAFFFDGVNDGVLIYSTDLNSAFNPDEFTILLFARRSGAWSGSGNAHLFRIDTGTAGNNIWARLTVGGAITFLYTGSGTTDQVVTGVQTTANFFMIALTISQAAGEMKAYFNGIQAGATQTGLGLYVGNLGKNNVYIGSEASGANDWRGDECYAAIFNRPLTAAEILNIARTGGVAA